MIEKYIGIAESLILEKDDPKIQDSEIQPHERILVRQELDKIETQNQGQKP